MEMDRTNQSAILILARDNKLAASRVDYKTCDLCGFRLMRIETTVISDQKLIETRCPICEQSDSENPGQLSFVEKRLQYFDAWLATHGLNRETLESHYHLRADHFFDDIN
jgi:hypothetical protein